MTCDFCGNENVIIRVHEGTGQPMQWDRQGERPHDCPVPTIYCPECRKRMLQTAPCEHYQKFGYKAGENESFFIRLIRYPPQPRFQGKRIGTSAGNTRTKDTKCKKCGKDLNGWKTDRIEKHVSDHIEQERKDAPQQRLV